ncbi:hypothetical protein DFH08DRAFT_841174 [Mycena albidolilacea]|uniref:Uncharacterized protein n=1 Tax=Mycena albidolilacea TaxID=1033008 RepID=A0AAD7F141_9AGAR|nr:hypothetical protein DFH08DRAFT_841174 [Mycena albidolilacea]
MLRAVEGSCVRRASAPIERAACPHSGDSRQGTRCAVSFFAFPTLCLFCYDLPPIHPRLTTRWTQVVMLFSSPARPGSDVSYHLSIARTFLGILPNNPSVFVRSSLAFDTTFVRRELDGTPTFWQCAMRHSPFSCHSSLDPGGNVPGHAISSLRTRGRL